MALQQEIAFHKAEERIGSVFEVLIEGRLTEEAFSDYELPVGELPSGERIYVGRTYMDAPNVDGYVFVKTRGRELLSGEFIKARITAANNYDLIGEVI